VYYGVIAPFSGWKKKESEVSRQMKLQSKLLKGIDRTAKGALAAGLIALTGVTVWAGYEVYRAPKAVEQRPTLLFRCMDFELIEDGSIQALVRMSVENMPRFSTAAFNIKFNPYYIQPSYLDTAGGEKKQVIIDGDNASKNLHYKEDPAFSQITVGAGTKSPFAAQGAEGYERNEVIPGELDASGQTVKNGELSMYLRLDRTLANMYQSDRYLNEDDTYSYDAVQTMSEVGILPWEDHYERGGFLYINADGTVDEKGKDAYEDTGRGTPGSGANLGSLTFWVDPDHLTEMVTSFNENSDFLIGYAEDETGTKTEDWLLADLIPNPNDSADYPLYVTNVRKPNKSWGDTSKDQSDANKAQVVFDFIFPKVLVKADVAGGGELTVNAYQAYSDGEIGDIAETLQRYRPEITGTYADASEEDFVFKWGDTKTSYELADGRTFTPEYTVYRRYDETKDTTHDYEDRQNGNKWVKITNADYTGGQMYKGNRDYMVTQYFFYTDGDGKLKRFPLPMEVHLTVTPVKLVDATATKLADTYTQTEAKGFQTTSLVDFDLPDQALLSLSPVPGAITLTMPITTWTPNTIAGLVMPNQAQNWSAGDGSVNPGVYELTGPNAATIANYVRGNWKWVTTDGFDKNIVATRTVVADDAYMDVAYKASYVSTDDVNGSLELLVNKTDGTGETKKDFELNSQFRTYLPNGTRIDLPSIDSPAPTDPYASTLVNNDSAGLIYAPGTDVSARTEHQEDVARSINLGGWFYVSVNETGEDDDWSELIPVYVPPRTNYYTEVKNGEDYYNNGGVDDGGLYYNFDFSGLKAGLFPFYSNSTLPTSVVLPVGYTVTTTYDGLTGAEPGLLGQFEVGAWAAAEEGNTSQTAPTWSSSAVVDHGDVGNGADKPTDFEDSVYNGYGAVENHKSVDANPVDHATADGLEQVHMRVQAPEYVKPPESEEEPDPEPQPVDGPKESLRLIHEDSRFPDRLEGITRGGSDGEVSKVTYTLQSEGYVDRQTYTLTLENNGTTDIYGLSVNVVNGSHKPDDGLTNHFEIIVPPSSYLPAGGKTTFTVTYVYNLFDTNDSTKEGTVYEDELLITSNLRDYTDPLKKFTANFEVQGNETYKVTVVTETDPDSDIDMGTAGIVKGPATNPTLTTGQVEVNESGDDKKPALDVATDTYISEYEYVWINAEPTDEYRVREVYYINGYNPDGTPVKELLYTYHWSDDTGDEDDITSYFFKMPAKNVTVVVVFYEPLSAKLRLSRLMGYTGTADDAAAGVTPTLIDPLKQHNVRWYDDTTKIIQTDPNYKDEYDNLLNMSPEDSSRPKRPDYLIVLGDYANEPNADKAVNDLLKAQLQVRLRENVLGPNIDDVTVDFFEYNLVNNITAAPLGESQTGKTMNTAPEGSGRNAPTTHSSVIFDGPEIDPDGEVTKMGVEVRLSCKLTQDMIDFDPEYKDKTEGDMISRSFVVVILRPATTIKAELNYGNSPKGMIYNDSALTDKAAAWTAFQEGDRFAGGNTPNKAAGLKNTYWKEAWGGITYDGKAYNGDQDEHALFILLGEDFQDPGFLTLQNTAGFPVDPADVVRTAEVELLDTKATTQVGRFNGAQTMATGVVDKAVLNLGTGDKGVVTSETENDVVSTWWQVRDEAGDVTSDYAVRPGVYTMTYTFPDYDGVTMKTVTRPLIILAPVGDVNADGKVSTAVDSDVAYIQNRVADPLGGMQTPDANTSGAQPAYPAWRLFRYRSCDTNNDRNVNNIDANQILRRLDGIVAYYKPTDYCS